MYMRLDRGIRDPISRLTAVAALSWALAISETQKGIDPTPRAHHSRRLAVHEALLQATHSHVTAFSPLSS